MRIFAFIGILCVVAVTSACTGSPTSPVQTPPYSQSDIVLGTGATAANGNTVTVDYTGWLYDPTKSDNKGLQFDTSVGKTPFAFTIGTGSVITGWDNGIPGMNIGGTRRLIIPPSLAYGDSRSGPIPPNATLVFDIKLLDIAPVVTTQ